MDDPGEYLTVRWAGQVIRALVVQRYKNGRIKVEIPGRWVGGRSGSLSKVERITVEPWQVIPAGNSGSSEDQTEEE